MAANPKAESEKTLKAWRDFEPGTWQTRVNLRAEGLEGRVGPFDRRLSIADVVEEFQHGTPMT